MFDHRMARYSLQGALGDALHSINCMAGYDLRWLMWAIVRLGIGQVFSPVSLCVSATTHRANSNCLANFRQNPLLEKFDCRSAKKSILVNPSGLLRIK